MRWRCYPKRASQQPVGKNVLYQWGYQGDEAQRAAFEASRISIIVVKRTDTQIKGFVVLPKTVVCRTHIRLDQPRAAPRKGFRGDNRILARMATIDSCFPAHSKAREVKSTARLNFESGS